MHDDGELSTLLHLIIHENISLNIVLDMEKKKSDKITSFNLSAEFNSRNHESTHKGG